MKVGPLFVLFGALIAVIHSAPTKTNKGHNNAGEESSRVDLHPGLITKHDFERRKNKAWQHRQLKVLYCYREIFE